MGFWKSIRGLFDDAPGKTPEELFADEAEKTFRAHPGVTSVERKPDDFSLLVSFRGAAHTIFLANLFAETRDLDPATRRERIRRFVAVLDAPSHDVGWEAARPNLVPILRSTSLYTVVADDPRRRPLRRDFVPFVDEWLAIDSPDSLQIVTAETLTDWKVEPAEAFEVARENAKGFFARDRVEPYDERAPYGFWHVAKDDDYQPSRLFVPGWLARFEGKVPGRPVAILPHRSALIVGGDGDERCLRRLVDTAVREYAASPRRISPALYAADAEGRLAPLVLPPGHPVANVVALGHEQLATAEYEGTKEALQKSVGEDVFVSSYAAIQSPSGAYSSYTVWTEDVPTLLAEAAEIAFVPNGSTPFRAPWKRVRDLVADCLALEPDMRPPRWRTLRWPPKDAIAKLRAGE